MRLSIGMSLLVALAGMALTSGCKTEPKTEADATKLSANADATLADYKAKDPSVQAFA